MREVAEEVRERGAKEDDAREAVSSSESDSDSETEPGSESSRSEAVSPVKL